MSVLLQAESGDMPSDASTTGERLATRLQAAMNAHDLEAFVACFVEDYDSVQPAHPDRAFRGREQVRANWSAVFSGGPTSAPNSSASTLLAARRGQSGTGRARKLTASDSTWSA